MSKSNACFGHGCQWSELQDELQQLRAELDAAKRALAGLQADALRYQWLHQFDNWSWSRPPMRAISFSWSIRCTKEELDTVIDAALAAKSTG